MIPAKRLDEMSEKDFAQENFAEAHSTLGKFERAKILEVYFARLDGRMPENVQGEFSILYTIDLRTIKGYLLGQHPQDAILHKLFKVMN